MRRVDRNRFFLLTSAIAAGACPTPVARPPAPGPTPTPTSPHGPVAVPRWPADSQAWVVPYDPEYCVGGPYFWTTPPICVDPKSPPCSKRARVTSCRIATKDTCRAALATGCPRAVERLVPEVAADATACLEWSVAMCGVGAQEPDFFVARCLYVAATKACPDPSAEPRCRALVARCPTQWWTVDDCRELFSGLTKQGRTDVEACMTASGCAVGPGECLAFDERKSKRTQIDGGPNAEILGHADVDRWMYSEEAPWQPTLVSLPGLAPAVAARFARKRHGCGARAMGRSELRQARAAPRSSTREGEFFFSPAARSRSPISPAAG